MAGQLGLDAGVKHIFIPREKLRPEHALFVKVLFQKRIPRPCGDPVIIFKDAECRYQERLCSAREELQQLTRQKRRGDAVHKDTFEGESPTP